MPRQDLVQLRRGTNAAWVAANPVLAEGEPGWVTGLDRLVVGDGATAFNDAPFKMTPQAIVLKTADQTLNNVATLTNDTQLVVPITAGNFLVEFFLIVNGPTGADIVFNVLGPGNETIGQDGPVVGATTSATDQNRIVTTNAELQAIGTIANDTCVTLAGIIATLSAGTIQLQWRQNAATVGDTIVRANSWMRVTKV